MIKIFLGAIILSLVLSACNDNKQNSAEQADGHSREEMHSHVDPDGIVKSTALSKEGIPLELTFNNTENTATLQFEGETIELAGQRAASGIWYKNDHYELRGKGDEVELTRDGKSLFKSVKAIRYGEQTLVIAAATRPSTAGVQKKDCMQVKFDKEGGEWELFYDTIEGFNYEPGYEYELVVKSERVDNPPADAPGIKYTLVKEVSRLKK